MRILHTADIHLKEVGDKRWAAFEAIVDLAEKAGISVLVISGDMFDRDVDAERLKVAVRGVFHEKPFRVAILPGNHDDRAIKEGEYFGERVTILDKPGQYVDVDEARLFGLPFEKGGAQEVLSRLFSIKGKLKQNGANILLYHGELLDRRFDRGAFGDEEEAREYMPARLSFFDDLGFDYVLAGHFHTNFDVFTYEGGYFVYPGSPVAITRRETGRRGVNLFEVGGDPKRRLLETHHVEAVQVRLSLSDRTHPVDRIASRLEACHSMAEIHLTVSGYVDLEAMGKRETDFAEAIEALRTPQVASIQQTWRDVGEILQNDIYKRFAARLEATDLPDERKADVRDLVFDAFSEAMHAD